MKRNYLFFMALIFGGVTLLCEPNTSSEERKQKIKQGIKEVVTQDLRRAIKEKDMKRVFVYILLGADVNDVEGQSQPQMGKHMLADAIESGSIGIVELLLKKGASVESQSDLSSDIGLELQTRYLPHLSYAIAVGASFEIIKTLTQHSKDVNIGDFARGRTPYEIANYYGRAEVVAFLKESGAKTDILYPCVLDPENK